MFTCHSVEGPGHLLRGHSSEVDPGQTAGSDGWSASRCVTPLWCVSICSCFESTVSMLVFLIHLWFSDYCSFVCYEKKIPKLGHLKKKRACYLAPSAGGRRSKQSDPSFGEGPTMSFRSEWHHGRNVCVCVCVCVWCGVNLGLVSWSLHPKQK